MNNPIKFTIVAPCSQTELHRWYGYSDVPPTTFIEHIVSGTVMPLSGEEISVITHTANGESAGFYGYVDRVSHDFSDRLECKLLVHLRRESVTVIVSDGWKGPEKV